MEITKEIIEKELGFEIENFKVEPLFVEGECVGLSVNVQPKSQVHYINTSVTICKSGDFNIDDIQNNSSGNNISLTKSEKYAKGYCRTCDAPSHQETKNWCDKCDGELCYMQDD